MSSRHVFTKDDLVAMKAAAESLGSQSELARRAKINQPSSINNYINGNTPQCSSAVWERLAPILARHYQRNDNSGSSENETELTKHELPEKKRLELFDNLASTLKQLAPGHQIVTGNINVYGVPNEKIIEALKKLPLSEQQKKDFLYEIFDKP